MARTNVYEVTFTATFTTLTTVSSSDVHEIRGKRLLGVSVSQASRPIRVRFSYLPMNQTSASEQVRGYRMKEGWVRQADSGSFGSDFLSWQGDIPVEPGDQLVFYAENRVEADQTVRAQVLVEE